MELDRLKTIRVHGFAKLVHTLVMIITYPLRHIFKTLFALFIAAVIIIAVPMIKGIPFAGIANWYLMRYDETKADLTEVVNKVEKEQPAEAPQVTAPQVIRKQPQGVEPQPTQGRKAFKVVETETAPKKQYKIMKLKKAPPMDRSGADSYETFVAPTDDRPLPEVYEPVKSEPKAKPVFSGTAQKEYYRKDETLPLVYEDTPQEVSGKTFVFSASELSVGDAYLILYGIYTDPSKYDVEKAHQYLKELVDGKNLRCMIVAYTYNNIATGVCFLNGISINRNMVDAGFADNVAL